MKTYTNLTDNLTYNLTDMYNTSTYNTSTYNTSLIKVEDNINPIFKLTIIKGNNKSKLYKFKI